MRPHEILLDISNERHRHIVGRHPDGYHIVSDGRLILAAPELLTMSQAQDLNGNLVGTIRNWMADRDEGGEVIA